MNRHNAAGLNTGWLAAYGKQLGPIPLPRLDCFAALSGEEYGGIEYGWFPVNIVFRLCPNGFQKLGVRRSTVCQLRDRILSQ